MLGEGNEPALNCGAKTGMAYVCHQLIFPRSDWVKGLLRKNTVTND